MAWGHVARPPLFQSLSPLTAPLQLPGLRSTSNTRWPWSHFQVCTGFSPDTYRACFLTPFKVSIQISSSWWRGSNYRQTSLYYALLYRSSQILHFSQIEGWWQRCVNQVCRHHSPDSICSLHVSVPHLGNSRSISNFIIIIFVVVDL